MNKTCLIYGTPVSDLPFGYDEEDELCIAIKLKIAEIVAQLTADGVTDFVSDCEYGISMWGAEIVLAQKIFTPEISLRIYYMPHDNQAVKWAPNWRERYFGIHRNADDVINYNNYEQCMKELCESANVLVYVGNDSPNIVTSFHTSQKTVHRISF